MSTVIRDWCPECKGSGHTCTGATCSTSTADPMASFVAWAKGCCGLCGGDGMVTASVADALVDQHGRPLRRDRE